MPSFVPPAGTDELSLVVDVLGSTGSISDAPTNIVFSLAFGDGSAAFESNLVDSLCFLAFSTGPKTLDLNRDLFAFRTLDRKPLAILSRATVTASFGSRCVDSTVVFPTPA